MIGYRKRVQKRTLQLQISTVPVVYRLDPYHRSTSILQELLPLSLGTVVQYVVQRRLESRNPHESICYWTLDVLCTEVVTGDVWYEGV